MSLRLAVLLPSLRYRLIEMNIITVKTFSQSSSSVSRAFSCFYLNAPLHCSSRAVIRYAVGQRLLFSQSG